MRIAYFAMASVCAFSFFQPMARAQFNLVEGLYCNSGLHPDGYIDLSGLPPSPTPQGTTPITATLPVTGVAGLNVTVSILPLTDGKVPAYAVNGGHIQFNNLQGTGTLLTLAFNQPVKGVGLSIGNNSGRFNYSYNLGVVDEFATTNATYPFSNTASGTTIDELAERSENLQLVALDRSFPKAAVQFSGDIGEGNGSPYISNIRVQSTSAPALAGSVPTDGLQMWLTSAFANIEGNYASTWHDQSGNGHDATASSGHSVEILNDTHTCQPAFAFNGSSPFNFNLPIGGNEMTVFMVASSTADPPAGTLDASSSGIFWTGDASGGKTFISPYQTHIIARFGSSQRSKTLKFIRPNGGIGEDFTITRAVHSHDGTDSLFVNGTKVLSEKGNNPMLGGANGDGTIGAGMNGSYYNGEIAEILVYNRVLSHQEAAQVENYLKNKFGIQSGQ